MTRDSQADFGPADTPVTRDCRIDRNCTVLKIDEEERRERGVDSTQEFP
jgi:hypothetical protein